MGKRRPFITDRSETQPRTKHRAYLVSMPQYAVMKNNQRNCMVYRMVGHKACMECKLLNFEKYYLCCTVPVMGSDRKTPLWKE